jgi:hypothetical protein
MRRTRSPFGKRWLWGLIALLVFLALAPQVAHGYVPPPQQAPTINDGDPDDFYLRRSSAPAEATSAGHQASPGAKTLHQLTMTESQDVSGRVGKPHTQVPPDAWVFLIVAQIATLLRTCP